MVVPPFSFPMWPVLLKQISRYLMNLFVFLFPYDLHSVGMGKDPWAMVRRLFHVERQEPPPQHAEGPELSRGRGGWLGALRNCQSGAGAVKPFTAAERIFSKSGFFQGLTCILFTLLNVKFYHLERQQHSFAILMNPHIKTYRKVQQS